MKSCFHEDESRTQYAPCLSNPFTDNEPPMKANLPIVRQVRAAFTLMEMMLVLAIIALLIAIVVLTLFESAYMAETVRGGLQGVPKGQGEAALVPARSEGAGGSMLVIW